MSEKKEATFVVKVVQDENNSWHGQVTWADQNEKANFRSAFELIQLMDNAIQTDEK